MCYNRAMTERPSTVFMGSPDFAVPALERLAGAYPIVGAVTQPDRPAGRGRTLVPPPVKEAALRLGIPVIQPERLRHPEAMEQLRAWAPDLIVVAAFGQILKPEVLDLPRRGCINVHPSLLPLYRGAAPLNWAIIRGETRTGVTIMQMDEGMDSGDILLQEETVIGPCETVGELHNRLAERGAQLPLRIGGVSLERR